MPKGSILGLLLFIVYINDLKNVSYALDPIAFADNVNLVISDKNVNVLLTKTNLELQKINEWFKEKKLSLSTKKSVFPINDWSTQKGRLPLALPVLSNENRRNRKGVLLDENMTWKGPHKHYRKQISKNIWSIFRPKKLLNEDSLTKLYYSCINCYLNYVSMTWASIQKTKLRKLHLKQKHAIRIVWNENIFTHTQPLMRSLQVLNDFQVNIQENLVFMHRVKTCSDVSSIFANKFIYPSHRYPTNFSKNNFALPKYPSQKSKYKISIRGPSLWNKVLSNTEKELQKLLYKKQYCNQNFQKWMMKWNTFEYYIKTTSNV